MALHLSDDHGNDGRWRRSRVRHQIAAQHQPRVRSLAPLAGKMCREPRKLGLNKMKTISQIVFGKPTSVVSECWKLHFSYRTQSGSKAKVIQHLLQLQCDENRVHRYLEFGSGLASARASRSLLCLRWVWLTG